MTSLSEVYAGGVGTATDRRRQILGTGLFVAGAAMVVGAIPLATTDLAAGIGFGTYEARELAGVLAGLGLPAVFVGIFAVLPAGKATRAAGAIGASMAILGVAVFSAAYPGQWLSNAPTLAVGTTVLYAAGTLVTFWCLFVGVATFKRRNDPGGSARLEITDEGTVRVLTEDTGGFPGLGGVGLFGGEPDGEVATQTNRANGTATDEDGAHVTGAGAARPAADRSDDEARTGTPASDGAGAVDPADANGEASDPAGANTDVRRAVRERGRPDRYCGNCTHFEYVRADSEITPYCGLHGDLLDDMDACDQWESNG